MLKLITAALLLATPFALPEGVFAHAFGQQYTLPIPVWIFLYGGALAVALSFLVIGLFVGKKTAQFRSIRLSKNTVLRTLSGQAVSSTARIISLGIFILLIIS